MSARTHLRRTAKGAVTEHHAEPDPGRLGSRRQQRGRNAQQAACERIGIGREAHDELEWWLPRLAAVMPRAALLVMSMLLPPAYDSVTGSTPARHDVGLSF